jgi:hypothetical protein
LKSRGWLRDGPTSFIFNEGPASAQSKSGDIENNCEEGKSGNGEDHEALVVPFQQSLKIMLKDKDGNCQIIYEGHDCE